MKEIDRVETELRDYLALQEYNELAFARSQATMVEKVKDEIDFEIMHKTDLFWESISYDSWSSQALLDELWIACYHRDTAAAGQILLRAMEHYLYSYHWEQIRTEWENFNDG